MQTTTPAATCGTTDRPPTRAEGAVYQANVAREAVLPPSAFYTQLARMMLWERANPYPAAAHAAKGGAA